MTSTGEARDGAVPKLWRELSKREAMAVCEAVAASQPNRAAAAATELERVGPGPADFSMSSLERLWPAIVEAFEGLPIDGDVAGMSDPPAWARHALPYAARFGATRVRFISSVGAYLAEAMLRSHPLVHWTIADVKGHVDFRKTVLAYGPDGPRLDPDQLVAKLLSGATADDPRKRQDHFRAPGYLREQAERRLEALTTHLASMPESSDGASIVSLVEHLGDRYTFTVRDEVDDVLSDRIDDTLGRLREVEGIDAVERTDRERFEVVARSLDASAVHAAVQATMQSVHPVDRSPTSH